eukprot:TRINITY_DN4328_c0_g1_i1.p1 TRINITY_DN4328_c0_g1~~TRINITY_DN4328_c0_g1_i1.p1  ORF type:complete len:255 (+),score=59.79 TRINITY_DN4328_c0_g1_i1:89-766(+)
MVQAAPVQYGGAAQTDGSYAPMADGTAPPQAYPAQAVVVGQPTGDYPVKPQPQQQQQQQVYVERPAYVISGRNPAWQVHFANPPPQVNEWAYGLCDCCQDVGLCCDVYWCTPCMLSRLHPAVEDGISDTFSFPVCALLCGAWAMVGSLACCLHVWYLRDRTRLAFGIQGNPCADCCTAWMCLQCAVCQMHRELRSRGVDPGVTCCKSSTPQARQVVAQPGFVVQQ